MKNLKTKISKDGEMYNHAVEIDLNQINVLIYDTIGRAWLCFERNVAAIKAKNWNFDQKWNKYQTVSIYYTYISCKRKCLDQSTHELNSVSL